MSRLPAGLLLALVLTGSVSVSHPVATSGVAPEPVEVPFGRLASGSTVGTNATNASVSLLGTLLSTTTNVLYLNNTNTTGAYYAKLSAVGTEGLSNLLALEIGIDTGTKSPQVVASLGSLTSTSGAYVLLPAGSTNTIYVTCTVSLTGVLSSIQLEARVADDTAESAFVITRAAVSIT